VTLKNKKHTFDHLPGRYGIICTFQVTGRVIEHGQALGKAICFGLKDVHRAIDLCNEILCLEVPVPILPWLKNDAGPPAE
jgi:hypothetical protein